MFTPIAKEHVKNVFNEIICFFIVLSIFSPVIGFAKDDSEEIPPAHWQAVYMGDLFRGFSGGLQNRYAALEKLANWKGYSALVNFQHIDSTRLAYLYYAGGVQGFNNIEYGRLSSTHVLLT